jgi:hypothetical protein
MPADPIKVFLNKASAKTLRPRAHCPRQNPMIAKDIIASHHPR